MLSVTIAPVAPANGMLRIERAWTCGLVLLTDLP